MWSILLAVFLVLESSSAFFSNTCLRPDTSAHAPQDSIQIFSPKRGDHLKIGVPQTIRWSAPGLSQVSIYFSRDSGKSWIHVALGVSASADSAMFYPSDPPSCACVIRLSSNPDGTGQLAKSGLFCVDAPGLISNNSQDVTSFDLGQNYPNPFAFNTTIDFALPRTENISLNVFDNAGSLVVRLLEGLNDGGMHSVSFHADGLKEGVYWYRLSAGSTGRLGRMIVMH